MKNTVKVFGTQIRRICAIALVAVIGFSFAACDNGTTPDDPPPTPTVTSVTVSPKTPNVVKGQTQQFTATVTVTNGAAQTVTWSIVETGKDTGTTINASGVLTVAAAETLTSLTIKATSTVDTSKSDTATVTIYNDAESLPTVTDVTVNPSTATVAKGGSQTFTATVTVTNGAAQTVSWSIDQTNKNAGTTINASGVLTIAAAETLSSLTVRATSTVDDTKSGTATVTITTPVGSGQYASKDVLGNSYSISVGSNASSRSVRSARAAVQNDRFSMDVTGRDGRTRKAYGKVKDISADGTLTLETDEGVEFTAVVGSSSLDSVASDGAEIPFSDGTTLVPRTFDNIYLRANRWSSNDPGAGSMHGEQLGSGLSVLVKDFPTNVSRLEQNNDRYTITISGTVDRALPHVSVEVQGLTENDEWVFLANNTDSVSISAGSFNKTITLNNVTTNSVSHNLLDYKEIILQVTDVINMTFDDHPDWNQNYGSLPAEIPNGQIGATISNFNISLKDTYRDAFKGNTNDYYYGFQEDGFSVDYRQAVWNLTPENIAAVKKANAKFEFILMDNNIGDDEYAGPTLDFIWQDPVRGLWWQDQITISGGDEGDGWKYKFYEGTTWDAYRNKVTLDLSSLINDNRFAASTQLNFIIACWYNEGAECRSIGDLTITGANIYNVPDCAGNMGNYLFGYEEDGISIQYTQAVWHLPEAALTTAQTAGAKLEIVFSEDLASKSANLALVWADIPTNRWWPSADEAGTNNANLILTGWKLDGSTESYQCKTGVTYDSTTKKLTVVLPTALETYGSSGSGFSGATDVNFVLTCWYGVNNNITELGIVSANIVSGS